MSNLFHGFDLGRVVEIRIRSYVVGPGFDAELVALGLEVRREDSVEPELVEIEFYEGQGPSLATAQAAVATLNRVLRERRGAEG